MNTNDPRFEIIRRCRDGEASPDELAQLEAGLRDDTDFRHAYARYINIDVALSAVAKAKPFPIGTPTPSHSRRIALSFFDLRSPSSLISRRSHPNQNAPCPPSTFLLL